MMNTTGPFAPGWKSPKSKAEDGTSGSWKEDEGVHVIREIGRSANWPLLTKTNYTKWALVMKIKMQARNLWDAIEPRDVSEDRMALDAITSAVSPEMVASLSVKAIAAEAWDAVTSMRVGGESVHKTKAQRLRREFEGNRFKEGESVNDFVMRLSNLVAALSTVNEIIEENKVVEKLLRVIPKRLSTVAIEVTADLTKLTLEDVGGRLHAVDDRTQKTTSRHRCGRTASSTSWMSSGSRIRGGAKRERDPQEHPSLATAGGDSAAARPAAMVRAALSRAGWSTRTNASSAGRWAIGPGSAAPSPRMGRPKPCRLKRMSSLC
uniref:DUF4219 domain-containing protein n=1 Tax=Arundo donax TaxID=35708 RepID=A0A0A8XWN0_ARUDO